MDYKIWFQTRVERAMADRRAPFTEAEWAAIRLAKIAERDNFPQIRSTEKTGLSFPQTELN